MLATDPVNHVAIALWPVNPPGCSIAPLQIGVFNADSAGNLTTTDSSATMPSTLVGSVDDLKISPSGDLIAAAGSAGLQCFHFNGANPVTAYTPVCSLQRLHQRNVLGPQRTPLRFVGPSTNKLHVFNVNAITATEAKPGSPYVINAPIHLAVQSPEVTEELSEKRGASFLASYGGSGAPT